MSSRLVGFSRSKHPVRTMRHAASTPFQQRVRTPSVFHALLSASPLLLLTLAPSVALAAPSTQPARVIAQPQNTPAAAVERVPNSLEQREIQAQLSPRNYTVLASEIAAKINSLPVREGGSFPRGKTLVTFDCSIHQAQLAKAQAALNAASKTWEANKRLAELNSVGRVELEVSEAEVAKNKAEVASMKTMLSKCTIVAPFPGRVSEQKVREQQFVQPGQQLIEIIDDSVLEIEFLAPSKWLAWLKPGHAFSVRIDETGRSYPAKILRVGAKVDPVSQSIKLFAAIDGKFPELVAGMSGHATLKPPAGQ